MIIFTIVCHCNCYCIPSYIVVIVCVLCFVCVHCIVYCVLFLQQGGMAMPIVWGKSINQSITFQWLLNKISSDQGPLFSTFKRSRQNFVKILIPVADGSTVLMRVTTPWYGRQHSYRTCKENFTSVTLCCHASTRGNFCSAATTW